MCIGAPPQFIDDAEEEGAQLAFDQSLIRPDSVEDEAACEWFDEEKRRGARWQIHLGNPKCVRMICIETVMVDSPDRPTLVVDESMDVIRDR